MSRTSLDPTLVQAYLRTRYSAGLDMETLYTRGSTQLPLV